MKIKEKIILGANHQFLFPAAIKDEQAHTQTLRQLAEIQEIEALDCWVWRGSKRSKEEISLLRSSGKVINYNIGDRSGEEAMFYTTSDSKALAETKDKLRREIEAAVESGCSKIVMGSGDDYPEARNDAKKRLRDLFFEVKEMIPCDVILTLEPADRNVDKHYLFGPIDETTEFVKSLKDDGFSNLGILIDMSHLPLIGSSIDEAIKISAPYLEHIHLGNCIVKNPNNPMFGDKHVPWGFPESEYDRKDVDKIMAVLANYGYIKDKCTISFEMLPIEGKTGLESLREFIKIFDAALYKIQK